MSIPVALENLLRVKLSFEREKLSKLRITGFQLAPGSKFVVRQIVSPSSFCRQFDEPAERVGSVLDALGSMHGVQVENDTSIGFPRPGKEAFVITFDEANCALDRSDSVLPEILSCGGHEAGEQVARRKFR